MIANQHTRVHTKPQEDSLRCFGPGDCGGKSTTAWSPQNPPWSPSSGGNPPSRSRIQPWQVHADQQELSDHCCRWNTEIARVKRSQTVPAGCFQALLWRFIRYFHTKEINKCSPVPPQLLCCVFNQAAGRDAPRVDLSTSLCSWDEAKTMSWCRGDTGLKPASKWPAEMMRHVWAN